MIPGITSSWDDDKVQELETFRRAASPLQMSLSDLHYFILLHIWILLFPGISCIFFNPRFIGVNQFRLNASFHENYFTLDSVGSSVNYTANPATSLAYELLVLSTATVSYRFSVLQLKFYNCKLRGIEINTLTALVWIAKCLTTREVWSLLTFCHWMS